MDRISLILLNSSWQSLNIAGFVEKSILGRTLILGLATGCPDGALASRANAEVNFCGSALSLAPGVVLI
jgi:hypothetical protein